MDGDTQSGSRSLGCVSLVALTVSASCCLLQHAAIGATFPEIVVVDAAVITTDFRFRSGGDVVEDRGLLSGLAALDGSQSGERSAGGSGCLH